MHAPMGDYRETHPNPSLSQVRAFCTRHGSRHQAAKRHRPARVCVGPAAMVERGSVVLVRAGDEDAGVDLPDVGFSVTEAAGAHALGELDFAARLLATRVAP